MSARGEAGTLFLDLLPVESWARVATRGDLFLGRFDAAALRRELDEAGLLMALAERGYPRVSVRATAEGDEHRLRLLAPGLVAPLVDLRLVESAAFFKDPPRLRLGLEVFSFLVVRGLVLQHPRNAFSAERPRLPGQEHPGLGLLGRLLDRLRLWAEDWGKDGLLAFPPHYHGAVLPGPSWRFLSPVRQGRLDALRRDLAALSLAEAARAIEEHRVLDAAGTVLKWEPAEMAIPLAPDLDHYIASEAYREASARSCESGRFRLASP